MRTSTAAYGRLKGAAGTPPTHRTEWGRVPWATWPHEVHAPGCLQEPGKIHMLASLGVSRGTVAPRWCHFLNRSDAQCPRLQVKVRELSVRLTLSEVRTNSDRGRHTEARLFFLYRIYLSLPLVAAWPTGLRVTTRHRVEAPANKSRTRLPRLHSAVWSPEGLVHWQPAMATGVWGPQTREAPM